MHGNILAKTQWAPKAEFWSSFSGQFLPSCHPALKFQFLLLSAQTAEALLGLPIGK